MKRRGDRRYKRSGPIFLVCILALQPSKEVSCFVSQSLIGSVYSISRPRSAFSSLASSSGYLGSLSGSDQGNIPPPIKSSLKPSLHKTKVILEEENEEENEYEHIEQEIQVVKEKEYSEDEENDDDEEDAESIRDSEFMAQAIIAAQNVGGERGKYSPFPRPIGGAVLVAKDNRIIAKGYSSYNEDCVEAVIRNAGINATPLREWVVSWPADRQLREDLAESTLYLTLEPSAERKGSSRPPLTQLIQMSGIPRVVIGAPNPIPEFASEGAAALHSAGISVSMGVEQEKCEDIISSYAHLANSKLQKMARQHLAKQKRPLGFLHCSVIDSVDIKAFARNGNAFGKDFGGGQILSMRDFGTYGIAPPPESIWAAVEEEDEEHDWETEAELNAFFEEEEEEGQLSSNPIMPWYEQVDAVVSTFPKAGNGPLDDDSVMSRLKGLKWLATQGKALPTAVERILVMDATDLPSLPLTNDDPNLPPGTNIEEFWKGEGRKPTRVLLRHSSNALATAAADAAAAAAEAAKIAAEKAREAIDSCDAEAAAEAAIEYQNAALAQARYIQKEVQTMQDLRDQLTGLGVVVETIRGGEPIDVMNHLGARSGYQAVVWRAGCWGERGVESILHGAFQWVSAHLAVDAGGGKFWQLMLAERCVQGACGPERKVKVFAEDEDISLEYCDDETADADCAITLDGRQIRHVRLDCRIALVDDERKREFVAPSYVNMKKKFGEEDAPWFL